MCVLATAYPGPSYHLASPLLLFLCMYVNVFRCQRGQKAMLASLGLESVSVVSHSTWMLGTKVRSSGNVAHSSFLEVGVGHVKNLDSREVKTDLFNIFIYLCI